ncbi:MAG: non-canonical purine NTP pyrophosphatase [Actinomycetota bacterium]
MRAVFASRNRHKAEQVGLILSDIELVAIDDVAPDLQLVEPFSTFRANALHKGRVASDATGLPVIADDSGLEVPALGGAPGVQSARFAGENATDAENNAMLVELLREVPPDGRGARYRCVAVFVAPDGEEIVTEGFCDGTLVLEGRGDLGFGYDPHFVPEDETRTMGEIPLEEKLRFSHRGRAFRALADRLAELGKLR